MALALLPSLAPDPLRNPARLDAVRRTELLDARPNDVLDRLTRLAARLTGADAVAIELADAERRFLASCAGPGRPDVADRSRSLTNSFCAYIVRTGRSFVVADVRVDPLVFQMCAAAGLDAGAYAGIPLTAAGGHVLGSLCTFYREPHLWTPAELDDLAEVAAVATAELELRIARAELQHRDTTCRALLDRATEAIVSTQLDGTVTFWNEGATRMFGRTAMEMLGTSLEVIVPERHRERHKHGAAALLAGGPARVPTTTFDVIGLRADGAEFPLELSVGIWESEGQHYYTAIMRDVSERRRASEALERSLSTMRATLESTTDGIIVLDADGRAVAWNRKFRALWRLSDDVFALGSATGRERLREQVGEHGLAPLLGQVADRPTFLARMEALAADPTAVVADTVTFIDGRVYERYSTPHRVGDEIVGRVWSVRDVTARTQLEAELTRQAFHDALTGLANRALFRDRVAHALQRAEHPSRVAVVFLDLDDFKAVNDGLGHLAGDQLLVCVADRLRTATRARDTVARLGGDEFAVLVEDVAADTDAVAAAEAIAHALSAAMRVDARELNVRASIGVVRGTDGETVDVLLRNADLAMYMAKRLGKGRIACYEPAMHASAMEHFALGTDLRQAMARNELSIVFQPIVHLASGRLTGAEALLRWEHPTRGSIPPAVFIPIAEEAGLVVPIGRWVLRETCRLGAAWQRRYDEMSAWSYHAAGAPAPASAPPTVGVNVSGRQLLDPSLASDVAAALEESGLAPERLVIEITESVVMQDTAHALETLQRLKAIGVQIAIDDFGTGYSSLSYLQRFPVDVLKIDKSFVADIADRWSDATLARTILALGHTLGLRCVAEGIETEVQRDALCAIGCAYGQGFLFSAPVPFETMVAAPAGTPS